MDILDDEALAGLVRVMDLGNRWDVLACQRSIGHVVACVGKRRWVESKCSGMCNS